MRKNGLLTFCCAFIPGCGQMYQGYMRRGLSLAVWFWGAIFIAVTLEIGVLSLFLPIIWAYSFFDTFNIRALSEEQRRSFRDDFIPDSQWISRQKNQAGVKSDSKKIIAWSLIAAGALILYNNISNYFYWYFADSFPFISRLIDSIVPLSIAVAVIVVGIRMLQGPKPSAPSDDITPFEGDKNNE